jgi:hypothetical protein
MRAALGVVGVVLVAAGVVVAWRSSAALLAAWLATWWWCAGLVMGALANLWMHNLTGGRWGEGMRADIQQCSRAMLPLALLFLPVLIGMHTLYPWAQHGADGAARWAGALPAHTVGFKSLWLSPWFFAVRSVVWLAVWTVLAALSRLPAYERSRRFAAAALIVYSLTASLAAVEWIMSLMPLWYSSGFGLVATTAQMLSGFAFVLWRSVSRSGVLDAQLGRDLGNLLLMYLMTCAYLSYMQFLVIWSANLPHEIAWYVARRDHAWPMLAWALWLGQFAVPMVMLLFRRAKQAPPVLAALALAVVVTQLLWAWWLVLPSVGASSPSLWWAAIPMAVPFAAGLRYWPVPAQVARPADGGVDHA